MRSISSRVYLRVLRFLISKNLFRIKKRDDNLNWGIIGTGYMATIWADLLLLSKTGVLHSVCSRSTENASVFGRKFGCSRLFTGLEKMLESEGSNLNFIYVATPLESHYQDIKACIEAGVNVLTEKPATTDPALWEELTTLARKNGVLLIEAMWMRCLPSFRQAKTWIDSGKIGEVKSVKVDLYKFERPQNGSPSKSVLMDYGVYALNFTCSFLGGPPDEIECTYSIDSAASDTDWTIIARRNDISAVINMSSVFQGESRAAVYGDSGLIVWNSPFNRTNEVSLHDFGLSDPVRSNFRYRHQGFEYQLEEATKSLNLGLTESKLLSHAMTLDTLKFVKALQDEIAKEQVPPREERPPSH